jgi:hypothetical protein
VSAPKIESLVRDIEHDPKEDAHRDRRDLSRGGGRDRLVETGESLRGLADHRQALASAERRVGGQLTVTGMLRDHGDLIESSHRFPAVTDEHRRERSGHQRHEPAHRVRDGQSLDEPLATCSPPATRRQVAEFEQFECQPSRSAGCTDRVGVGEVQFVRARQRCHGRFVLTPKERCCRQKLQIRRRKTFSERGAGLGESLACVAPATRRDGGSTQSQGSGGDHHAPTRVRARSRRTLRTHRGNGSAEFSLPQVITVPDTTTQGPHLTARPLRAGSTCGRHREWLNQIALTSSGMPGPNVVETAPFWM